jgi:hypothetical protein
VTLRLLIIGEKTNSGAFLFSRDNDAAPSVFDGIAGWGWAISLSWVTA